MVLVFASIVSTWDFQNYLSARFQEKRVSRLFFNQIHTFINPPSLLLIFYSTSARSWKKVQYHLLGHLLHWLQTLWHISCAICILAQATLCSCGLHWYWRTFISQFFHSPARWTVAWQRQHATQPMANCQHWWVCSICLKFHADDWALIFCSSLLDAEQVATALPCSSYAVSAEEGANASLMNSWQEGASE